MLLVDRRVGSRELLVPLKKAGLPAELDTLEFADIAFMGRGIGGAPLMIGIERKTIADLVQSMVSKRLPGYQLPGLLRTYDPELTGQRVYLVVEGEWRVDNRGRLVRRAGPGIWKPIPGAPPASALRKQLLTLATRAGVTVWPTLNRADTVAFVTDLYQFWTDTSLDEHRSHLAVYAPDMDRSLLSPPSLFRQVIGQLPGVGSKTAEAAEAYFEGSIVRAVNAPLQVWREITTTDKDGHPRRFGEKAADRLLQAIRKGKPA